MLEEEASGAELPPGLGFGAEAGVKKTIYLAPDIELEENERVPGATYVDGYSLVERYETPVVQMATDRAKEAAKGNNNSALYYEKYLQYLLEEDRLRLVHIVMGGQGRGLPPYRMYGYVIE